MMGKRLLGVFVVLAVLAAMAVPLFQPLAVLAAAPDRPVNQSPSDLATGVSLTPTLRASAFQDPTDNDTMASSQWWIVGVQPFDGVAVEQYSVLAGYLSYNTVYTWQVRYRDSNSEWSDWSTGTDFQTVGPPQAAFTASTTAAEVGDSIFFTNSSSGGSGSLSYLWNFGDGDTSTSEEPTHAYDSAGTFTVTLTVTDPDGPSGENTSTQTRNNYIAITDPLVADFTAPSSALVGQAVTFTNGTDGGTPPYSYQWAFGDGGSDTGANPSHTYNSPGAYTVTLTATDSASATDTQTRSITVVADLVADFTATPLLATLGQAVVFNTTGLVSGGTGPYTYQWDFDNNGTVDGSGPGPSYTYTTAGKKSVKLVVTDSAANTETVIKTDLITVALGLQADFSADPLAAAPGEAIKFTSQVNGVVGTAAYAWDFNNDGTVDSIEKDPSYAYSAEGTFTVVLAVTDGAGTVPVTKANYIVVTSAVLAGFSADKTAVTVGQTVKFTNQSGGGTAPLVYEWDFNGDNKADSVEKDPSYTYSAAGSYKVRLKVTDSTGKTDTETKDKYITVGGSIQVDFTASAVTAAPGQAVTFTGSVTGGTPPITYQWDFGDGGTSGDATVSHVYQTAGVYTVSLRVTDAGGTPATEQKPGYITVGDVGIAPCAIPAAGGVIQTADGKVSTTFPAGAYDGDATLTILEVSSSAAPKPPEGYTVGSACFTVEATDGTGRVITSLVRPATISMKYTSADLSAAGKNGGNLKLAYFTTSTGKWTIVNTSFNDTTQTLSATTNHFSTWAILVKSSSGGLPWWAKALIVLAGLGVVGIVAWRAFTVKPAEQRWPR